MRAIQRNSGNLAPSYRAIPSVCLRRNMVRCLRIYFGAALLGIFWIAMTGITAAQESASGWSFLREGNSSSSDENLPPRAVQARRFLAERGLAPSQMRRKPLLARSGALRPMPQAQGAFTAAWQAIGPSAVSTSSYGLITGRVAALALDPADVTGNRLYVGTTGGGVWFSQNAAASNASFTPLTDTVSALSGSADASISIGALTVQPGATGVVLAGTGDPNDALDSYYGAGILRSSDGGNSWSLIDHTADLEYGFMGEGFAGFAWSTVSPQLAVAAVSQAFEGTLVDAVQPGLSYQGLYYSSDSGLTWNLAIIMDGSVEIQGPTAAFAYPDGNAATAVVWNPVRKLFIAAIRYHGYYQSSDGMTWTRLAAQPGANLTAALCPPTIGEVGSVACPIFGGALAVNPQTGDTFAWTTDAFNQDQGLWQDACALSGGVCTKSTIAFATQWKTTPLESSTSQGAVTIANGDYNLTLAAVPSGQDTLLLAGANDLWKCSLAVGCVWRNTTNAATCMSAQVGGYQHALAWNPSNPLEVFLGNDSGLWRSTDAIAETGSVCAATDAAHFQNLNGAIGSLAEVVSLAESPTTPYTLLTGLGENGTAGVKGNTAPTGDWPQILSGDGGPVAIDPVTGTNWYVNNAAGVYIHLCSQATACNAASFGASPAIDDADVGGDGLTMTHPAPFLVDPLDDTQLLIGTCRVWRGPATGAGWSAKNAVSQILDRGTGSSACNGDALIRSMAALALPSGKEVVYVGMYGSANGGSILPGHLLTATIDPASSKFPVWTDLTLNPVTNDTHDFNDYGLDISSIFVDPHDATGQTIYVTVEGMAVRLANVQSVYRSTDGGAHWASLLANLPLAPASSVTVDPQDANTVYLALDTGVYATRQIAFCATGSSTCWSAYGTGLPEAPVVQLVAAPATSTVQALTAATYGRGVWQIPLATANTQLTVATVTPPTLTFANQSIGTASAAQTVTLANTGSAVLTVTSIAVGGDFSESDNCQNLAVSAGASCAVQVTFTPFATGSRTGQMTINANVAGGQLMVALSGTGTAALAVNLAPVILGFGTVEVGATSASQQVTLTNAGASSVALSTITVSAPFTLLSNACGTTSLAAYAACQLTVEFLPTAVGAVTGTLTVTDAGGTQSVQLTGTGVGAPTDTLSPASLTFSGTIIGQLSAFQTVSLSNSGGLRLTAIATTVTGPFQVSNNCGTQLNENASCSIDVIFAPTAAGLQSGTLAVSDALRTQTVSLSGTGLLPPIFSVTPPSLSFAAQAVGTTSSPFTLTVSNTGGAAMANVGFQITGASASSFALGITTCGALLSNGSSCTVQVSFTPVASGGSTAALTISSSTIGVPSSQVPLTGNGSSATALSVTPTALSFSVVIVGQSSAAQTVTIANTGSSAATALTLAVFAPFSLVQDTCTATLAAGANCSVGVVFTPTIGGAATSVLSIASTSVAIPSSVALGGTGGLPASIQATPGSLGFGTIGVGQSSNATTVTIANLAQVCHVALRDRLE